MEEKAISPSRHWSQSPDASGWPPWHHPRSFLFPILMSLFPGALVFPRSFLSLLAGSAIVGLHPLACKPCSCPTSRLKKELRDSDPDINGSIGRETYPSEARSRSDTLPCAADSKQDTAAIFATAGVGEGPAIYRVSSWLISNQGNQRLRHFLHCSLSIRRCFPLIN